MLATLNYPPNQAGMYTCRPNVVNALKEIYIYMCIYKCQQRVTWKHSFRYIFKNDSSECRRAHTHAHAHTHKPLNLYPHNSVGAKQQ